jgi:hypothetical protein
VTAPVHLAFEDEDLCLSVARARRIMQRGAMPPLSARYSKMLRAILEKCAGVAMPEDLVAVPELDCRAVGQFPAACALDRAATHSRIRWPAASPGTRRGLRTGSAVVRRQAQDHPLRRARCALPWWSDVCRTVALASSAFTTPRRRGALRGAGRADHIVCWRPQSPARAGGLSGLGRGRRAVHLRSG